MKAKLFGRIAAAVLLLSATTATAHDFEVNGIYYNYNGDGTVRVTYKGGWYDAYKNEYSGVVTIPASVTYSGKTYSVTSIGNDAFKACSDMTAIVIPNSVESIGESALDGCSGLRSLMIPNSVTSIGDYAFSDCSGLESITVESGNSEYDSRDNCNAIINTSINSLICGCKNTIIPNTVHYIDEYAFAGCTGLTSVEIPKSVGMIGEWAFYQCSNLTSVEIPESVRYIRGFAFAECSSLTSVVIPSSVNAIYSGAFYDCSGLKSVTSLNTTPPELENNVFFGLATDCVLYVPEESIAAYKVNRWSYGWSSFARIMAIPGTEPSDVTCEAVQDDVNPADFYATFSNNATDVELHPAAGATLTVYDVTVNGTTLVLTPRDANTVARGEAVLVKTSYNTFTASPLSGSALTPAKYGTATLLVATPSEAQTVSCQAGEAKLYRLTYYDIDTKTGLGFYWGNSDGTQIKAKPGKGYLKVPTSQAAEIKGFRINPLPTHVDGIDAEVQGSDEPIYDLSGRRVENPTSGIYLQNNKKIIVK